jgi:hypothetical protein
VRIRHRAFSKLPNKLALEGHTDSKQYPEGSTYGNWELSTDRSRCHELPEGYAAASATVVQRRQRPLRRHRS